MIVLTGRKRSQRNRLSAPCRHSEKRAGRRWREQDRAVGRPCAAAPNRRIGDLLHGFTDQIDALQFAFGKESDGASVRRPEREDRAFSAGQ